MNENGFTTEGVGQCFWQQDPDDPGWCLYTVVDGETTYAASMGDDLAPLLRPGQNGDVAFYSNPTFRMQTSNFSDAQELKINLESGALPTTLDVQSELFLAPSLAQQFKPLALLTGLVAWLVVSGVVFYRYREVKVAVPLLLTAVAEVFLLLGFAAAIGLALDLSHIAGLIAVIGTGVDDLVIIADEILQRGEIKTGRVFKNRFRKAFWVIGAAAATTIIAMSPLAVLSLGDLQGFAIVTIVGVLIGVLVTRPAYGNILRNFLLEE
jgi:preprotein translocase subunit SecD